MLIRPITAKEKEELHTRYVIMCCVDIRPFSMASQPGFQYFIGGLHPSYAQSTIHHSTMERILDDLAKKVRAGIIAKLEEHINSAKELGYDGPFFGLQSDMTSTSGTEFCTLAVSFVPKGATEMERLTLTTKAFPGRHTADDIVPWLRKVSSGIDVLNFATFVSSHVQTSLP